MAKTKKAVPTCGTAFWQSEIELKTSRSWLRRLLIVRRGLSVPAVVTGRFAVHHRHCRAREHLRQIATMGTRARAHGLSPQRALPAPPGVSELPRHVCCGNQCPLESGDQG